MSSFFSSHHRIENTVQRNICPRTKSECNWTDRNIHRSPRSNNLGRMFKRVYRNDLRSAECTTNRTISIFRVTVSHRLHAKNGKSWLWLGKSRHQSTATKRFNFGNDRYELRPREEVYLMWFFQGHGLSRLQNLLDFTKWREIIRLIFIWILCLSFFLFAQSIVRNKWIEADITSQCMKSFERSSLSDTCINSSTSSGISNDVALCRSKIITQRESTCELSIFSPNDRYHVKTTEKVMMYFVFAVQSTKLVQTTMRQNEMKWFQWPSGESECSQNREDHFDLGRPIYTEEPFVGMQSVASKAEQADSHARLYTKINENILLISFFFLHDDCVNSHRFQLFWKGLSDHQYGVLLTQLFGERVVSKGKVLEIETICMRVISSITFFSVTSYF